MMERLSTGIPELDNLIQGGIPKGFFVAVTGEPGTGKTILCMHFIWEGIRNKQMGIYVTTEESRNSIIAQAEMFGWDFLDAMVKGDLIIIDALIRNKEDEWSLLKLSIKDLVEAIIRAKKRLGYGHVRLVIDSLSAFWLDKPAIARKYAYFVKRMLLHWDLTILATSQYAITTSDAFGFGVEHIADGIIRFRRFIRRGVLRRYIIIEKMRQTNHDTRMWEIEIVNKKGLCLIRPATLTKEDVALQPKIVRKIIKSKQRSEAEI